MPNRGVLVRAMPRNYWRSGWVIIVNCTLIYFGLTGGPRVANYFFAAVWSAGIVLELCGSPASVFFNVAPFLYNPLGWAWLRATTHHTDTEIVESNTVLLVLVLPSLLVATVNLFLYVPPLLRWWRGRKEERHGENRDSLTQ